MSFNKYFTNNWSMPICRYNGIFGPKHWFPPLDRHVCNWSNKFTHRNIICTLWSSCRISKHFTIKLMTKRIEKLNADWLLLLWRRVVTVVVTQSGCCCCDAEWLLLCSFSPVLGLFGTTLNRLVQFWLWSTRSAFRPDTQTFISGTTPLDHL